MLKKIGRLVFSLIIMCLVTGAFLAAVAAVVYYLRLDAWVAEIGVMLTYAVVGLCGGRAWKGNPITPSTLYWAIYIVIMRIITPGNMKNVPQLILIWVILICSCALGCCRTNRQKKSFQL
ncbi:MAG: hypothetical protein UH211_11020 [Agathobacter sp.]|nr:hypothetical protein [Agathobacter sp.]